MMPGLNQMDLQNLRHLIGVETVAAKELNMFAQQCNDPQLKNFLQNAATKADQNSKTLMGFLQG